MEKGKYLEIVKHYESCLEKHGDTHLGVDWPNAEDVDIRHAIMLELIRKESVSVSLLDFGCGLSHLYEYILKHKIDTITYSGLDISQKFIALSKKKFPGNDYYCLNVLEDEWNMNFDYLVLNGVFTEKRGLTFDEMFHYFKKMLKKTFMLSNKGVAFNVMSKHVDWEREDLFHLPFDILAEFLTKELTRNYVIRCDYGLFEYTVYLYKDKYLGDISCRK
jgi:hypothetical protein